MQIIARIHSEFPGKFGVPRQAGLVEGLEGLVVFEPEFRRPEALRGLEEFSHIWLLWQFSRSVGHPWSPTVRPPRLGGNARLGVFATRSPFRPNPIGLSAVRLEEIRQDEKLGPVLLVRGADLMDGTPIYDIKPYIPYSDCRPEAAGGFTETVERRTLQVQAAPELLEAMPPRQQAALLAVLAQDPRPSYQQDGERVYGMDFARWNVRFSVRDGVLQVLEVEERR